LGFEEIEHVAQINNESPVRQFLDRNGPSETLDLDKYGNNPCSVDNEPNPHLIQETNNLEGNEDIIITEGNDEIEDKTEGTKTIQQVYTRNKNKDVFGKHMDNDAHIWNNEDEMVHASSSPRSLKDIL
jgi:hypothetical protein